MDIRDLTIESFGEGLRGKEFSAREVTAGFLEEIATNDAEIGAYLDVYREDALAAAGRVDAAVARGEKLPPLAGVPLAVKDNILVEGKRTTAASRMLEHYTASYDATVTRKLKDARAILLGKTNLDEFAMGSSTEHSALRVTKNPHDLTRVPGGSSGGSAAAVAGHLALAALGSDTSGSISQPAAFCGVVGLRPTYGAVSRFGLIAMASSLDQVGPLARTVRDVALVYDAIRGRDPHDATSIDHTYEKLIGRHGHAVSRLVIGIPEEFFVSGIDATVAKGLDNAMERLAALGFSFKKISLPHVKYSLSVYYIIQPAETSANLARFDGVRYPGIPGERDGATKLRDLYFKTRGRGFGPEPRRRILLGTFVLSAGYYDAYYTKAQKVRRLIADDFEGAFDPSAGGVDAVIAPVTPTTAFTFGEKVNDPLAMYLSDIFTTQANLAGLPSLSIPVKRYAVGSGELPVGFQLIGKRFHEDDLFGIGEMYERT
jgi:aspartyl-tRNA(Asn)/glutamyl-tRNA(Gln) amidotransferase subunit A